MAQVNPALGTIGGSRGSGETADRAAMAALLSEFNGNIDSSNLKAAAGLLESQLAAGATGLGKGSFSATRVAANSLTALAWNTLILDVEDYDQSNWYDNATGRFTPQTKGLYVVEGAATLTIANATYAVAGIFKNGTLHRRGSSVTNATAAAAYSVTISTLVDMNGSTDFVDLRIFNGDSVARSTSATAGENWFSGYLQSRRP